MSITGLNPLLTFAWGALRERKSAHGLCITLRRSTASTFGKVTVYVLFLGEIEQNRMC